MFSDSGVIKTLQENPMFQELLFSNPELTRDMMMSIVDGTKDLVQVIHPALSFK